MVYERDFQAKVIEELKRSIPGAIFLKNDSGYMQGIPDWIMLVDDRWFMLEFKRHKGAVKQRNQDYYINLFNEMSGAWFISPENKEEVLNEIQSALRTGRDPRIPIR